MLAHDCLIYVSFPDSVRGWSAVCYRGNEVIKLEFILRHKIKRNDWLLVDKQPIIALYFESGAVLVYSLAVCLCLSLLICVINTMLAYRYYAMAYVCLFE